MLRWCDTAGRSTVERLRRLCDRYVGVLNVEVESVDTAVSVVDKSNSVYHRAIFPVWDDEGCSVGLCRGSIKDAAGDQYPYHWTLGSSLPGTKMGINSSCEKWSEDTQSLLLSRKRDSVRNFALMKHDVP